MKTRMLAYRRRFLALGSVLALAPVLEAAQLNVAATGSDDHPGTAERPFATLGCLHPYGGGHLR